jgi:hypothetical protein
VNEPHSSQKKEFTPHQPHHREREGENEVSKISKQNLISKKRTSEKNKKQEGGRERERNSISISKKFNFVSLSRHKAPAPSPTASASTVRKKKTNFIMRMRSEKRSESKKVNFKHCVLYSHFIKSYLSHNFLLI